ncbi:T9SS type A sorting domain-containing protein [Mesonia ostreae]|uniref:T9SS type A sorting domain-containing protein n=1 Tax=Mesonia ostreae TaxID=861110 RepID=A0ABU2KGJ5_9FLAO|nr:T9SS type A sorting domain-containing protein [Mesonia ostreae]MDT0293832.1 T9SS type A sorting domain-containing protein [Mesonia ostreae]
MKKTLPTGFLKPITFLFAFLFSVSLSWGQIINIKNQSFENSGNNWNYSVNPDSYNISGDVWDIVASLSSISPNEGSKFWGMQDLDNNNGGGSFAHTLTFSNENISAYSDVELSFFYHTIGYDSTDSLSYELVIDNVSQGEVLLPKDDSGTISINISTDYPSANEVGIIISAKQNGGSDYAGVDNFQLNGISANANDLTTEVYEPTNQVVSNEIIAADVTTSSNSEEIFGFIVEDQASGDGLPTNITKINFVPGANNTADWTDHIQGIVIFDENLTTFTPTVTITDNLISLEFSTPISIADGDSLEFLTGIYLNTTNIVDQSIIQFEIPGTGHGFQSDINGSSFADPLLFGAITGNNITIDVDFTESRFFQQPTNTVINTVMDPGVMVAAVDVNGNVDTEYNLDLSVTSTGSLVGSPVVETAVNGIANFNNLVHSALGTGFTLTVSDDLLPDLTSDSFDILAIPSVPTPGSIYITEISDANDFENEFIEIFNITNQAIDLSTTKLVMLPQGTVWDLSDFNPTTIPAKGFAIISRGNNKSQFENEFGSLNANTNFIEGSGGMFFGTDRSFQLFEGGTADVADGTLIDETGTSTANGQRIYQNIFTGVFVDNLQSNANPGELDYLLYANGAWINNDAVDDINDQDVLFYDNFTANSPITTNNLYIDAGKTLKVQDYLLVEGNEVVINGDLLFASESPTQIGTLGPLSSSAIITGEASVERIIPPTRAFRFLSSSVTTSTSINANWQEGVHNTSTTGNFNQNPNPGFGTHITGSTSGANGLDATDSGNPSLFTYDNATLDWNAVTNTDTNTLTSGEAYRIMIRGSRGVDVTNNETIPDTTRLRMKGSLTNPSVDVIIPTSSLNTNTNAYNFVGNPYQAVIDMNSVLNASTDLNTNQYYVWDPNKNVRGAYVTVSLPAGINSDASEANQFAQPNQAFFVQTNGANPKAVFAQSHKVNEGLTQVFKSNTVEDLQLTVQLFAQLNATNEEILTDSFMVLFNDQYSNDVTDEDAGKLGNLDENIALVNDNSYLSIEKRSLPFTGETLPFFNNNYRNSNYTLKIEAPVFNEVEAYLVDNYLQEQTLLNSGENVITFMIDEEVSESISDSRFSIIFEESSLQVVDKEVAFAVYPNPFKEGGITINSSQLEGKNVKIQVSSILGQEVYQTELEMTSNTIQLQELNKLNSGVYILSLTTEGQTFTKKIIKK